ncbi:hypothetical protein BDV95DRAFT_55772 [Massariosphaeria phaeospora]|uniref:Uncharacterized protein n=1 Tax=Massariosphaeria phaeospora TaxID=100035 RepID=A0A7C8MBD0_9PLEO|nr:hypothetical protein BDV95DRAFT_55772 [Massariosphaeria phaeospora]
MVKARSSLASYPLKTRYISSTHLSLCIENTEVSSTTITNPADSSNQSISSSRNMSAQLASTQLSSHSFLPQNQASAIRSWTFSVSGRSLPPHSTAEGEVMSRDAAIQAYPE